MNEVPSPSTKRRLLIPKYLPIPLCPNIPCSGENHLREERVSKILPSCLSQIICGLVWLWRPRYPKVVPDPVAVVASEEKMSPILMMSKITKHTGVILDDPMSPLHHISGIQ